MLKWLLAGLEATGVCTKVRALTLLLLQHSAKVPPTEANNRPSARPSSCHATIQPKQTTGPPPDLPPATPPSSSSTICAVLFCSNARMRSPTSSPT
ncbi:hypothetical protein PF002_g7239 [Phytophthora fragariae]|uniref:Secreted protein n=2 Tax=Phytophthora fragariae TaxID=53985 RepID=A0A6A3ZX25_9STRA|nr:hypothetical protein PF003_g26893 [Phytophthora fragariae]KAE9125272.1 hypothetical protein PF007_g6422 [Phytophthora fragariae]KAE9245486.1 hypothetical protein PF002_g7239 [Phytophthora fragariae]